jgi:hypothetical protein
VCWAELVFAEHPRAIMTRDVISRMRAKVAAHDAYWQALRGSASTPGASCDRLTAATRGTPDRLPPVFAPRETISTAMEGYLASGYQGQDYYNGILNLIACSYAVAETDKGAATR